MRFQYKRNSQLVYWHYTKKIMTDTENNQRRETPLYAGLFRRLFAIFYDGFLLIALFFVFFIIATALNQLKAIEPDNIFYSFFSFALFFGLSYLYFAWFWIHGGQTLGMKTWHIQIQSAQIQNTHMQTTGDNISWKTAAIRYIFAIASWAAFGLGFLWALFDKKNRCWHDLISKTVLIDVKNRK